MKPIDRLKEYLDYKQIKPGSVDRKIGTGNGYIGKQIRARASVGSDILEKMFLEYPDLNPVWLLTGNGEMLAEQNNLPAPENYKSSADAHDKLPPVEQVRLLKLEIELKEIEIAHLKKKMEILNSFKNLKGLSDF